MAAPFALATGFYVFGSAFLLFAAAVVVRQVFGLVSEAKSLTRKLKAANERLGDVLVEVRVETETAAERAGKIGGKGRAAKDRRRGRRRGSV